MLVPIPSQDPYDLEVVYPQDSAFANSARLVDVDVVAVHGLNIEGNLLHYRDTWTKDGRLWLKDYLPDALQQRCRVMLFAWSIGRVIVEHDALLSRHANHLLLALKETRYKAPNRPLMFVCHDLGGLVVKDALIKASQDESGGGRAIFDATKLLVFFNTPHRELASTARRIAQAAIHAPTEATIKRIEHECNKFAERLEPFERYRRLYVRRLVFNLHATNSYRNESMLVDKQGTSLQLPDYWEKQYPVYGDHTSICRFGSFKDAGCQIVLKTIAMDLTRAIKKNK